MFGWVANWRPAEILPYERLTDRRRLALYRRLADATVEIREDQTPRNPHSD